VSDYPLRTSRWIQWNEIIQIGKLVTLPAVCLGPPESKFHDYHSIYKTLTFVYAFLNFLKEAAAAGYTVVLCFIGIEGAVTRFPRTLRNLAVNLLKYLWAPDGGIVSLFYQFDRRSRGRGCNAAPASNTYLYHGRQRPDMQTVQLSVRRQRRRLAALREMRDALVPEMRPRTRSVFQLRGRNAHGGMMSVAGLAPVFAALLAAAAAQAAPAHLNGFELEGSLVPAADIHRGGPPKDGIAALTDPRFVSAADAKLSPEDRVVGVALGGVAKAYPIRILNWHEVVNDAFAGRRIAVTYCPLCGTAMVFDAVAGGRRRAFGVSGLLYNSDVLLYDRESESLWSQVLKRAVSGPEKGTALTQIPARHTTVTMHA